VFSRLQKLKLLRLRAGDVLFLIFNFSSTA